ncbi:hypothetical protein BBD42_12960 [Paenibacillus sp. BIHB 4019]|uniref:Helix-turn-helix domain-containing protein n=1 Tax=Paenibacillus sp. BIHB 4019 TaxID=1870819 RepID=A0A1B2DHS9_9BACL|nr:DNA-binding protein [Paenibacillus sp. BIHB 4019]ANY67280.1 hypothetical protein BBD42_12960 [Paenibacillus sp. BIHB 4019]
MKEYRIENYPHLLAASHVSEICSCHLTTAYEIMKEPHRPRWQNGRKVRLHRDVFFEQIKEESMVKVSQ